MELIIDLKMATMRFVDKSLSVFVGNISTVVPHEEVEEVIYELFLQVSYYFDCKRGKTCLFHYQPHMFCLTSF